MSAAEHLGATRLLVDTALGIGTPLVVVPAWRDNAGTVLLLCEATEDGVAVPLAELHPPNGEYSDPPA